MATAKILVTGGSGQIGGALARLAAARGLEVWAPDRTKLDLTKEGSIKAAIRDWLPSMIVNCAAYTAVDKAESEPQLAETINAAAPAIIANEAARLNVPIIHVSTDYVFDGTKPAPYSEHDAVAPINVYGRTKEAGETAVRAAKAQHAIIRTAWVLSADGANFLNTMLRLGSVRDEISVVNDQVGCPSSAADIADALLSVADRLGDRSGTWHFVNRGEASWYQLASHIFAAAGRRGVPAPSLNAIPASAYPTPASRPCNSRLATGLIENDFAIKPRVWQEAIDEILALRLQ
jgi:dTDP-4-dehydrorhamnose reductase